MKKQSVSINGTVQAYLLQSEGQVEGVLLSDGKQLHLPKHLSAAVQETVKPGDIIEAIAEPGEPSTLGEEFRTLNLTNIRTGKIVSDQPSSPLPKQGEPLSVEGNVAHWLVGHKGELKGFILSDGSYLHVPPVLRKNLTERVKLGDRLSAQGYGTRNELGTSITVETLICNEQLLMEFHAKDAHHYKQTAHHHELAAHYYRKAAKHAESGEQQKTAEYLRIAREHQQQALNHTEEADSRSY
ncbi:hypothetical protein G7B40_016995 [Aetokthonos hydrillicola Thurmond2011]|jgi:hypothetical protein|uniref:Uncharacterized protein n=1 Tax=Aetokthonos hydrillicola Thurmond2011 TaxID=2712845 RepID=A0AAP5I9X3_9CYAN|nr:hypothetical protein [Aetokthonos hydrillicola]MBO3462178.1 hypothetical protein [Aetokthonos hydrillicola CCALA 1050]MBW4588574.1 hypothetical protein [Aetokthonos hydrillicola CCALA 1050]MDR9896247.1 hypothetical protein [Aetokthonos hydrillicola Thurmond2011]